MSVGVELVPLSMLIATSFAGGLSLFDVKKQAKERNKNNPPQKNVVEIPSYILPTVFTDKETLLKTLDNLGLCYTEKNGKIETSIQNCKIEFFKESESFSMQITGNVDIDKAWEEYTQITDGYGQIVQSEVINNIKEKVSQSSSFSLESEEVQEDNSVVITINI